MSCLWCDIPLGEPHRHDCPMVEGDEPLPRPTSLNVCPEDCEQR